MKPEIRAKVYDDARTLEVEFDAVPFFESLEDLKLSEFVEGQFVKSFETDEIAFFCRNTNIRVSQFFERKPKCQSNKQPNGFECEYDLEDLLLYVGHRKVHGRRPLSEYSLLNQQLARWNAFEPTRVFRRSERQPDFRRPSDSWCLALDNGFTAILDGSPVNSRKFFELLAEEKIPDDTIARMLDVFLSYQEFVQK